MNVSDVFDWTFMWQVFRNFMATLSPFVMIIVAAAVAGIVITVIVNLARNRKA